MSFYQLCLFSAFFDHCIKLFEYNIDLFFIKSYRLAIFMLNQETKNPNESEKGKKRRWQVRMKVETLMLQSSIVFSVSFSRASIISPFTMFNIKRRSTKGITVSEAKDKIFVEIFGEIDDIKATVSSILS